MWLLISSQQRIEECSILYLMVSNSSLMKVYSYITLWKSITQNVFANMYKAAISTKQSVPKSIKADRKLLQRLLNTVTRGRLVEMKSILKAWAVPSSTFLGQTWRSDELHPKGRAFQYLDVWNRRTHRGPRGWQVDLHADWWSDTDPGTWKASWVPNIWWLYWCLYTQFDTPLWRTHNEESMKVVTRSKRVGKRKPICKTTDGP